VTFRRRDMPAPHPITASRKRATMRSHALLFCALLLGATAAAHADSLAESAPAVLDGSGLRQ
jgi:hypothetical protein